MQQRRKKINSEWFRCVDFFKRAKNTRDEKNDRETCESGFLSLTHSLEELFFSLVVCAFCCACLVFIYLFVSSLAHSLALRYIFFSDSKSRCYCYWPCLSFNYKNLNVEREKEKREKKINLSSAVNTKFLKKNDIFGEFLNGNLIFDAISYDEWLNDLFDVHTCICTITIAKRCTIRKWESLEIIFFSFLLFPSFFEWRWLLLLLHTRKVIKFLLPWCAVISADFCVRHEKKILCPRMWFHKSQKITRHLPDITLFLREKRETWWFSMTNHKNR